LFKSLVHTWAQKLVQNVTIPPFERLICIMWPLDLRQTERE
jgi:hypothetical protein